MLHFSICAAGHYLYIEASKPQASGDRARLISPRIEAERVCLDFWYHMYGRNVGVLKVYLVPEPGRRGERLWFKFGERGTKWHNAQLSISSGKPFQVTYNRGPSPLPPSSMLRYRAIGPVRRPNFVRGGGGGGGRRGRHEIFFLHD